MVAVPPSEEVESAAENMYGSGANGKVKENEIELLGSPSVRMQRNRGANVQVRVAVPRTVSKVAEAVGVVAGCSCRCMGDTALGIPEDTYRAAVAAAAVTAAGDGVVVVVVEDADNVEDAADVADVADAAAGVAGRMPEPCIDVLALVHRLNVAD